VSGDPRWDGVTVEDSLLLAMRAERLKALPSAREAEAQFWAAEFPVGPETFALPLGSLRGCIPLRMVSALPLSPPHVLGVVRFQGEIITAVSLSMLLGARGWSTDPFVLVVVRLNSGQTVALDCEQIPIQVELPPAEVERASPQQGALFAPVVVPGPRVVNLIDIERLTRRIQDGGSAD
jgi:purine-binding chemotaxis protein CheW